MKRIKAIIGLLLLMAGQAVAQTSVPQSFRQLPSGRDAAYDTNRGFIHPGGLHTQEDFDRVKAQIAANNQTVVKAWNKLTSSEYSQSGVQTYPTEIIVRGGGNGENYMNAARGAAMAYQNALRWKIAGTKANANAAVRILMAWARTTKGIGGDSNYALAAGLYGYQFAQAAELMRDYEGWSREDFAEFQRWMLNVWYPKAIGFLRERNGTWENAGKWWQAPGHYWSNWGLCNALCVISIGVLCDDVFIYNQGMSYFKYDQCGTFTDPRTETPIKNDGLTEYLGNFVVTTYESELETGAYGRLGQLNESGRDAGHSSMSLGVALDVAKVGWNQGDDLFAYMNHRLAAGIEYLAAQSLSIGNLPWVNYIYGTSGYYYTDSRAWTMTEPAMGAQMRPYWGTVIGIYEGVKGVQMPFAGQAYANMGIDGGGAGSTSGGYDHLGFSVLMNTRDVQLCPADQVPTELLPQMTYSGAVNANLIPSLAQEKTRKLVSGKTICHNELGGLVNTYTVNNNTTVPTGQTLTLQPQLPEGEEDTGRWLWSTGETTREITVSTDSSRIYRVYYVNKNGVKSQLAFFIASTGDCLPDELSPRVTVDGGEEQQTASVDVLYGKSVTLGVQPSCGWGTYKWSTGVTTATLTKNVTADAQYTLDFKNQGGAVTSITFDIRMMPAQPYVCLGTSAAQEGRTQVVASPGQSVTLGLTLPSAVKPASVQWSTGATGDALTLDDVQTSTTCTATFTLRNQEYSFTFEVFVSAADAAPYEDGTYLLRHVATDTYLTAAEKNQPVTFQPSGTDEAAQRWLVQHNATGKYDFISLATADCLHLATSGKMATSANYPFFLDQAVGSTHIALRTGSSSARKYWDVAADGTVLTATSTSLDAFPFELVPVSSTGIEDVRMETMNDEKVTVRNGAGVVYDLLGRSLAPRPLAKGIYVINGKKVVINNYIQ